MKISLKAIKKDTKDILDPLYNWDKTYDKPIMNVEIGRDENIDINHIDKHIIKLMKD